MLQHCIYRSKSFLDFAHIKRSDFLQFFELRANPLLSWNCLVFFLPFSFITLMRANRAFAEKNTHSIRYIYLIKWRRNEGQFSFSDEMDGLWYLSYWNMNVLNDSLAHAWRVLNISRKCHIWKINPCVRQVCEKQTNLTNSYVNALNRQQQRRHRPDVNVNANAVSVVSGCWFSI